MCILLTDHCVSPITLTSTVEMAMDDTKKEYILQWSGHASTITERFSSLLARQALVDVTLICQEQKLRVHRLVLASCSHYFEEMLEQDLGQEPIILLRDLDFDVLKAMVEFMYCGETTIAHSHINSLLNAAQVFKVDDLESIVRSMIFSTNYMDCNRKSIGDNFTHTDSSNEVRNCVQVILDDKGDIEVSLKSANDSFDDAHANKLHDVFNDKSNEMINANNGRGISEVNRSTNEVILGKSNCSKSMTDHTIERTMKNSQETSDVYHNDYEKNESESFGPHNSSSEDINNECDFSDSTDLFDIRDGVGECLRVYTHKKRESIDRGNKSVEHSNSLQLADKMTSLGKLSTDCIDLSSDVTCNTAPVTLSTDLDAVTHDNTWCLNTDSIRYVIGGCTTNAVNSVFEERACSNYNNKKKMRPIKELFSVGNRNVRIKRPILRRSERLNQPDIDNNVQISNGVIPIDKSRLNNIKSFEKSRGKMKEFDENSIRSRKNINDSKAMKSTSKYTTKSGGSNDNSTRSYTNIVKDGKIKSNIGKLKDFNNELQNKTEIIENYFCIPVKSNTIASVDRALWGDMSDVIENNDRGISVPKCSLSKEIPFAVGLLPLHAALERMQAMPDYQPRKTRSSFAPVRHHQDMLVNGVKRKATYNEGDTICMSRRINSYAREVNSTHNHLLHEDDKPSTFCHIEIHTSSECSQNPHAADQLVSIGSTSHDEQ